MDTAREALLRKLLADPPTLLRSAGELEIDRRCRDWIGRLTDTQVEERLMNYPAPVGGARKRQEPAEEELRPRRAWSPEDFNGKPIELIERDERLAARDVARLLMLAVSEYKHREWRRAEERYENCQARLFGDEAVHID